MWRRLVARYLGVVEVVGSSPVTPTIKVNFQRFYQIAYESVSFYLKQIKQTAKRVNTPPSAKNQMNPNSCYLLFWRVNPATHNGARPCTCFRGSSTEKVYILAMMFSHGAVVTETEELVSCRRGYSICTAKTRIGFAGNEKLTALSQCWQFLGIF